MLDSVGSSAWFFAIKMRALDSSWTRVGLGLDSRLSGRGLFFVQVLVHIMHCKLDSSWTHVGLGGLQRLDFAVKMRDGPQQPV